MTSLLRRKRPTTVRGPSTPTRRAASRTDLKSVLLASRMALAVVAGLLCGGLASAQTLGKPVPAAGTVLPAVHTSEGGELSPIQPVAGVADMGGMQRTAFQPRIIPPNPPNPDESVTIDFESELPSNERVMGRLESEKMLKERLKQKEKDAGRPAPIFPEYGVLTKEKYYGRQWPAGLRSPRAELRLVRPAVLRAEEL